MSLTGLSASRKAGRRAIADAIRGAALEFGADYEETDYGGRRELGVTVKLNGVGALVHVDDLFGGTRSLIHWFNSGGYRPVRYFSPAFNSAVGEVSSWPRPHHKATSNPPDWDALLARLKAGLALARSGQAFNPVEAAA